MISQQSLKAEASELQRSVEAAVVLSTTSKKKTPIVEAFTKAYAQVDYVALAIPKKVPYFSKTKKSLRFVGNILSGTLDGLNSNELTLKELRSISSELTSSKIPEFLDILGDDIQTSLDKLKSKNYDMLKPKTTIEMVEAAVTEELTAALNAPSDSVLKNSLSSNSAFKQGLIKELEKTKLEEKKESTLGINADPKRDDIRKYLASLQGFIDKIPLTADDDSVDNKPFSMFPLPVIPSFHTKDISGGIRAKGTTMDIKGQPNPKYILAKAGIKSHSFEEYCIIEKQWILAIDKKYLPPKIKKSKTKRTSATIETISYLEYAKYILDIMKDQGDSYELVSDTMIGSPREKQVVFFWIMRSSTLNFLTSKGFPKILRWGLPL